MTGAKPSKRLSHSACVYNNNIVIFGGCNENHVRLNDLHVFSLRSLFFYFEFIFINIINNINNNIK